MSQNAISSEQNPPRDDSSAIQSDLSDSAANTVEEDTLQMEQDDLDLEDASTITGTPLDNGD